MNHDLYRSGDLTRGAVAELAGLGIKTIVSLEDYSLDRREAEREAAWAEDLGIKHLWMPMSPIAAPTYEQVEDALDAIVATNDLPLLVHCKRGADRTGIVIAAYRLRYEDWTLAQATAELRSLGHSRALYWWDAVLDDFD